MPAKNASDPGATLQWLPHEAWLATRALVPCSERVDTAVVALEETPALEPERAAWIAHVCDEERLALRLEPAERAALALARRAPTPENSVRLARIQHLRGANDEARTVLTVAIDAALDEAAHARLLLERARLATRLFDERAALADLGAALAEDSDEAALDLARRALMSGVRERALVLSNLVLARAPDRDEALALYGRALLSAPIRPEALSEKPEKVP